MTDQVVNLRHRVNNLEAELERVSEELDHLEKGYDVYVEYPGTEAVYVYKSRELYQQDDWVVTPSGAIARVTTRRPNKPTRDRRHITVSRIVWSPDD